jgi:hypothetical protein
VGTLWSIKDADGPMVAEAFYERVFCRGRSGNENGNETQITTGLEVLKEVPDVEHAAEALKVAVDKLRDGGVEFERWIPFVHFGI